ncbi:hypothetical protein MKD33_13340, partial [Chromobacterium piscinae]
PAFLRRYCQAV